MTSDSKNKSTNITKHDLDHIKGKISGCPECDKILEKLKGNVKI